MGTRAMRIGMAGCALVALVGCGGGGGSTSSTPVKTAQKLSYTDPTSGTYQLKKNTALSTDTKLVLDLVASGGGSGVGVTFHLSADTSKVNWVKVADTDGDYVRNGAVFTLGSGVQALKGKVSGSTLQAVVSQKGLSNAKALDGVLATVALSLKTGVTPGAVSLDVVSGKAQVLQSSGTISSITISKGTLTAE